MAEITASGAERVAGPAERDVSIPEVSVIVPVFAQWDMLPYLMVALAAQCPDGTAPVPRFEVIIVNNESDPDLLAARAALAQAGAIGAPVRLVHAPRPGSYGARNMGAAGARAPRLVFTDADCRPAPLWLAAIAAAARARPDDLLAGPIRVEAGADPSIWEIHDALRGIPQERYIARGYATTANLSVPATAFRALGGFDAARLSGGDAEFCRRAARAGHALHLVAGAIVVHPARASREQAETKARRIKAGQVSAGPRACRAVWLVRSLCPPVREIARYLQSSHPPAHRRIAARVRLRLWRVELAEIVRLLVLRHPPERR